MLLTIKQTEFVQNATRRWNFKGGATRSGKTYLDFRWIIPLRIRERVGKEGLVVVLGVTKSTIERNLLQPMREIYGEALVGRISSDNTVKLFGEKCYALGAEKISQVSKIRGVSIKYAYGDEVAEWSEDVFGLLKSRLDRTYSCFDGTYNPSYPGHWLKKFLDSDADVFSQTYTIFDNPFLDADVVKALCSEYQGTVLYDRYILGQWKVAEGLVYPMFSPERHLFSDPEPAEKVKYFLSIDYGTINPTAAGLWRVRQDEALMLKEYYHDSRATGRQKTDEEYYADLEAFCEGYEVEAIIIDPSAASMKECIRRHEKFRVWDADNSVLDGIRLVGTLLSQDKVRLHEDCKNTIDEFYSYLWDDKADKDQVIKEHDHSMDQMRYLCQTLRYIYFQPEKIQPEPEKSDFPQLLGIRKAPADMGTITII